MWSNQDKHKLLEIRENGTEVFYSGANHGLVTRSVKSFFHFGIMVRADRPISRQGQFYFEICVENAGQDGEFVKKKQCKKATRV